MTKDKGISLLSDFVLHTKYARYNKEQSRRETYEEIVDRVFTMHRQKYASSFKSKDLELLTTRAEKHVLDKWVLPSMRSLQFAGEAIERDNQRMYNCCFVNITSLENIKDLMFLLLCGCGVGYSVQKHHISQIGKFFKHTTDLEETYVIEDSIQGWSDAIYKVLLSYQKGGNKVNFDYSLIRPAGSELRVSGGKAPGPEPLRNAIQETERLINKAISKKPCVTPLLIHDIVCVIANAVMVGGGRRAALISLFSIDDEEMLTCKNGNFWETNPQRSRANNSVVIDRNNMQLEIVDRIMDITLNEGYGEPGLFFTNDTDWGTNPCAEIALQSNGFCNLTSVNAEILPFLNDKEREEVFISAALIGTLQAGYTDFSYISEKWKHVAEEDALLGVSMTGLSSIDIQKNRNNLKKWARIVSDVNKFVARKIGINPAKRLTCIKPEGSTSCVLMTSSGVHPYHDKYFMRSVRVNKNLGVYKYLRDKNYPFLEDDLLNPEFDAVVYFPCKSPEEARTVDDTKATDLLNDVIDVYEYWIKPGHRSGQNTHNVSVTIPFKADEKEEIKKEIIKNNDKFTSVSLFPHSDNNYPQAPFNSITKEEYEKNISLLTEDYDFFSIKEDYANETHLYVTNACSGGSCEIL